MHSPNQWSILTSMRTKILWFLLVICCMFVLNDAEAKRKQEPEPTQLNQQAIQEGVMSFADSWLNLVSQGYIEFESRAETPELRISAKRMRFSAMTSAVEIATISHPGRALLDMLVLASLNKATWDRHWLTNYGVPAQLLSDNYALLEKDIWQFASRFAKGEQLAELRGLIEQWLTEHPEAVTASFVRLTDFGALRNSPALVTATKPGGWLSTARNVADAAQNMQELSERALFLALRMQEMMATRFELSVAETLSTPEILQLLDDVSGFRQIAEDYAVLMEKLPADVAQEIDALVTSSLLKIGAEREAMIEQAMSEVSKEREAAITQVMESISRERTAALEQTLEGIAIERSTLLKTIAQIVIWSDLQAKATFARIFILAACLFLLYFLLRLVYRYMRDRETFTFRHVLETVILLVIAAIPIMVIGVLFVEFTAPDIARIEQIETEVDAAVPELSEE
jgi:hypothetical protein